MILPAAVAERRRGSAAALYSRRFDVDVQVEHVVRVPRALDAGEEGVFLGALGSLNPTLLNVGHEIDVAASSRCHAKTASGLRGYRFSCGRDDLAPRAPRRGAEHTV